MCKCVKVCSDTCTRACLCGCVRVHAHMQLCLYTCTCVCVGMYMHVCVHYVPGISELGAQHCHVPHPPPEFPMTHTDYVSAPCRLCGGVRPQLFRGLLLVQRDPQHLHLHQRLGLCAVVGSALPDLCLVCPLRVHHPWHRDHRQGAGWAWEAAP